MDRLSAYQCHQMSRHAERYPTAGAGGSGSMNPLIVLLTPLTALNMELTINKGC